jgi:hypothetical protein
MIKEWRTKHIPTVTATYFTLQRIRGDHGRHFEGQFNNLFCFCFAQLFQRGSGAALKNLVIFVSVLLERKLALLWIFK